MLGRCKTGPWWGMADRLALAAMATRRSFLKSRWAWPAILLLAACDVAGLFMLVSSYSADAAQAEQAEVARQRAAAEEAAKPKAPPPPAMIEPPAVADMLQSGTLIVISKASQHMYVFSDGAPWGSTPVSTGKRRKETPSGIFPVLHKRRFHRSNLYSNAPMPFMQRLTWDGIALHAGRVPGYAASHGCVRMPPRFAEALFKLTKASETTVVIGNDPLENDVQAQQFALTTTLPIKSALAPPPDPNAVDPATVKLAVAMTTQVPAALIGGTLPAPPAPAKASAPPPPVVAAPVTAPKPIAGGQTIQLTAAASQAEAEAHWAGLLRTRPDISRFQKRVEAAVVNARTVYRLRVSGADAYGYCTKLKSEGIGCLEVG
jgi:lipoprotein-anchoring transpeptidase ErfK/SrfK